MRLERIRLELGEDSATLDGNLILDKQRGPVLNGSLQAHRLSLTRWLGFAVIWPRACRMALDNITDSLLEFELEPKACACPISWPMLGLALYRFRRRGPLGRAGGGP